MTRPCLRLRPLTTSACVLAVSISATAFAQTETQRWSDPVYTEQWSTPPAAKPPDSAAGNGQGSGCAVGAAVEVLSAGQWYKARILDGPDRTGTCKVTYDGYGSSWDEWVAASRIRPIAGGAAPARPAPTPVTPPPAPPRPATGATSACSRGAAVEVLYGGEWYKAKILEGPDRLGACLVSYDGYGSNWDEWVSTKRIRPIGGGAAPTPPAPAPERPAPAKPQPKPQPPAAGSVPPGTYSCYTLNGNQMNYTYTDVVVRDGARYAVGNKEGRYTLSAKGEMTFTGPLSNAVGKYSVKNTGRSQIDLIFNGDNWSSMACTRR